MIASIHEDSFLPSTCGASGCDLRRRHQVADVLLEELVVAVELVVFFFHGFDAVEDLEEGLLEDFGVSVWDVLDSFDCLTA